MLERDMMIKQLSKHLHVSQNHANSSRERLNIYMKDINEQSPYKSYAGIPREVFNDDMVTVTN